MENNLRMKQQQFNKAMNLYETKKFYTYFTKMISIINVGIQFLMIYMLMNKPMTLINHIFSFIIAYILADFWNGLVHMYMDNKEDYEGFWGPFIASFHLHHRTPLYRKNPVLLVYFNESGSKIWMALVEIIVILFFTKFPSFIAYSFLYFFILSSLAEVSHYFCHTVDNKAIDFLQKYRILLNKKHHAKHHLKDNMNYAFLNGMTDPLINLISNKFYSGYKNGTDKHYMSYTGNDTKNR